MSAIARLLQDQFGDPDGVVGLVGKHFDDPPARETVRKWFSRGTVPGEWLLILLVSLEMENGTPQALRAYLTGDKSYDIFS